MKGNHYQNSNDKDLFEWTQQSLASQFENNRYTEKDEECISRAQGIMKFMGTFKTPTVPLVNNKVKIPVNKHENQFKESRPVKIYNNQM